MKSLHSIVLASVSAAVIICLGLIIYFATLPGPGSSFSEFYLLNEKGRPYDYPGQVIAGQPIYVTIGIINHEETATAYTVRIMSGDAIIGSLDTGNVNRGQIWEQKTGITIDPEGNNRQIEFYLYITGREKPHIAQPLVLTLNVRQP